VLAASAEQRSSSGPHEAEKYLNQDENQVAENGARPAPGHYCQNFCHYYIELVGMRVLKTSQFIIFHHI